MTGREEYAFRQVVEKCNNALADNAVLVIEVNELRRELATAYREISEYKDELKKALGCESKDPYEDANNLSEFPKILAKEAKKADQKARKIPVPKVPKSVKTSKVKKDKTGE